MSTVNGNGNATVAEAVQEVFTRDGYLKADGSRDYAKMRARVFDVLSDHKVLNKKERPSKALLRGDLVASVFPNVVGPEGYAEEEEGPVRALLEAVYAKISTYVWDAVRMDANGTVQVMVGLNMGNGYVLCRTKIGKDSIDAVYITDNLECIRLDFTRPDNAALERKIEGSTRNREMLILRQPQNAKVFMSEYDRTLKNALDTAHKQLQLTAESVSRVEPEDEEPDDETPED